MKNTEITLNRTFKTTIPSAGFELGISYLHSSKSKKAWYDDAFVQKNTYGVISKVNESYSSNVCLSLVWVKPKLDTLP